MTNSNLPRQPLPAIALVLLSVLGAAAGESADLAGFRQSVKPFLEQHCVRCHGSRRQEADLALQSIDGDISTGNDVARWKAIAQRLALNEMPPSSESRPDAKAVMVVRKWIKDELAKRGESIAEVEAKLLLPGQGNRVDHDALFSGAINEPAASPARLWRCSPQIYSALTPRIMGARPGPRGTGPQLAQPFSTSSAEGFKDYAALFAIDEPTIVQLIRNARLAVELQSSLGGAVKPLLNPDHRATAAEMRAAIAHQFRLVLFREPTESELERFVELMTRNIEAAGAVIGVRTTLATVMLLPEALYRFELGGSEPDRFGRCPLTPRETAYALALALTDERPDRLLLEAAEQGKLSTREEVRREVQRLLADASISKPRIMRFFEEYFEFTAAAEVFKDFEPPVLKKAWQPEVLIDDTRQLIQYILDRDQDVLRELLTTNKCFVNYQVSSSGEAQPAWRHPKNPPGKKAQHPEVGHWYGLPADWEWTPKQPIEFSDEEHVGILTQPSWLAGFATNNENHAIRRGKWIRERLLGGMVPDVPINVDAKLPDAPELTLRERMTVTQQDYCWKCHRQMNPLGLVLENYDYLGRLRKLELDRPVETSGEIAGSGDARLNGEVSGAAELMHRLADSPRVRQVFVRHAFRYWMGRNEVLSDSSTLIAADKAYVESGGSMKALITSLLTSDSFLYRFVAPN